MSNLIDLATTRRNARGVQHVGWMDGGTLEMYTAPKPADADTAISTQTLLGTFVLPDPAGGALGAVVTVDPIADVTAIGNGAVAWARVYDDADAVIGDYTAGGLGSGMAIEMSSANIEVGDILSILSFTITEG